MTNGNAFKIDYPSLKGLWERPQRTTASLSMALLFMLINIVQDQKTVVHNRKILAFRKGGLTPKIHGVVDALGNLTNFFELQLKSLTWIEQMFGYQWWKLKPYEGIKLMMVTRGGLSHVTDRAIEVVIPPKKNRKKLRNYDRLLYKAGHLVENFWAKLKQY